MTRVLAGCGIGCDVILIGMVARFRAVNLDKAAFEEAASLHQAIYPETPGSAGELERAHQIRVGDLPYFFAFIEVGQEVAGYCALKPTRVLKEPGLHLIAFALKRELCGQGIEEQVLARIEREAAHLGALRLGTRARTDYPTLVRLYEEHGFRRVQSDLITGLDLTEFDSQRHAALMDRVRASGVEIVDSAALMRGGDGWLPEAYRLNCDLMADVLIPGGYEPRRYDAWVAEFMDPDETDLELQFYARVDGRLVGETGLFVLDNGSGNVVTGLTGVLPEYRRRGIATALKVASLTAVKARGLRTVYTGNERHIPMYDLNLALGYTDRYEDVTFWR